MGIKIREIASSFLQGALIQQAPNILMGVMSEFLPTLKVRDVAQYVKVDQSLWEKLPENNRVTVMELGPKLGSLDWFNLEWLMAAGKQYNTALYSALQEWPEGQAWLVAQIEDIKRHIGGN